MNLIIALTMRFGKHFITSEIETKKMKSLTNEKNGEN
jgi:hypothetical protein